jgi:1,4-dihydroxy-2-naphthoate octaprenyltransferase
MGLHLTASVAFVLGAVLALIPWWMAAPSLILVGSAWGAARGIHEPFERERLTRSIETTLQLHAIGSLSLLVAVLIPR